MNRKDIELVYELSPVQQGMLFQSVYAPGSGVYVVQLSLRLTGRLDVPAFEQALRHLVERHPILRTAFYWENLEKPLQVVYREVGLPLVRESWRGLGEDEQHARLDCYLTAERERGFSLGEPPLMRLALCELGDDLHQLVWSQHHLLSDGWSQGLLIRELFTAYAALAAGKPPALGQPRPYRDYIAWLQRQDIAEAEGFWRRLLEGVTVPTRVAGGEGVQATDFRRSRHRVLRLGVAETAALRETARRQRLTLNTLVQGAWALLLAHTTGARQVVFGTTVAGRPPGLPGADSIIGPFINTLPVPVEVTPEARLVPWLNGLQQRQVEMRRYDYVPLYQVQQWSGLASGAGGTGTALFDHLLVFENYPVDATMASLLPGLAISGVRTNELTNFPLDIVAMPGSDLSLEMRYDASRIEDIEVARLLEHLAALLRSLATGLERSLGEVPLRLPGERQQVILEWNDTTVVYGPSRCLHELVWEQAARTPDAVAAVFEGEALSYGELERRARRLAGCLAGRGVGPGARVGVFHERSLEMAVGLLGVLEAGAAYVPLDTGYPEERLAFMAGHSGLSLLLAGRGVPDALVASGVEILAVDGRSEPAPPDGPRPEAGAESLAYVIYTSGSTGRPKGVMVPHRAIVNRVLWMQDRYPVGPQDRVLQKTPISFDASIWELFLPWAAGGCVVLAQPGGHQDPRYMVETVREEQVTVLQLVPSMLGVVLDEPELAGCVSLRQMFCGGEALPGVWVERLRSRLGLGVHNLYGPTEAAIDVASRPDSGVAEAGIVPIGRPIGNTQIYLVSGPGELAAVTGEVLLGGMNLAWGYQGRPDLTAERFVPDPFGGRHGSRLYRTGDLARRRPDGELEYAGRADEQVKLRGLRIEPGEIEAVLREHPAVQEAAVAARTREGTGDLRLVAYVVGRQEGDLSDLRGWLGRRLPEHMVPGWIVELAELPRTPNGKLDRKALPEPEPTQGAGAGDGRPPQTWIEEVLAGIWSDVLGVERVGSGDDFFALGGHSLLVTRVVSRLRGAFDVELPLRALFEAPTLAELARRVEVALGAGHGVTAPPLVPVLRDGALPLSFAQQRLWFLDQLEPGNAAYNLPSAVRLTGELSPALLARVFTEIVRRHEPLRTTFAARQDDPVQEIGPPAPVDLPVIDLSGLAEAERETEARRLAGEEARWPFDLRRGPLLRLRLLQSAPLEHALLATMHHIVSDGWSVGVLLAEIATLYTAFAAERPSPLPELTIQYADFALWQRSWLRGEVLESQLSYWRRQLADAPRLLDLPLDRPRPAVQAHRGARRPVALSRELAEPLRQLCRRQGVTPFMALLAAWGALLGRHAGQEEVLVGTPIAGRNRREIEGLIGFFVNTLVLRVDLRPGPSGGPSFDELLGRVREASLGGYTHQDLPFERLVEDLVPERDLSRSPLFQVMLVLQSDGGPGLSLPGLTASPLAHEAGVAKFDLSLSLQEEAERFQGGLEYDTALFDGATMARLWARFTALLEGAVGAPERLLRELALLSAAERHQALVEWNDTRRLSEAMAELPLAHELIAMQARRSPAALAVVDENERLSYRELHERAKGLARELGRHGVGPDVPVALFLERSAGLVIGLLAILEAGGAFVPLDPAHAGERLAYALENSGAALVLTRRDLLASLPAVAGVKPLLLDEIREGLADEGEPRVEVGSENLAYLLYTSGSTGRPKGVMVPHRGLAHYLAWCLQAYPLAEGWGAPVHSSVAFDLTLTSLLAPLAAGKGVRLLPEVPAGEALASALIEASATGERFSLIKLTPAHLELLSDQLRDGAAAGGTASLVIGGEALNGAALEFWQTHAPGTRLFNEYGPTETVVGCSVHEVTPRDAYTEPVPIGRPIADTRIYLLDDAMEPALPGARGELFIGGAGVTRGYLGRPDLTADRFRPDSFGGVPGARLYRTGDLARHLADGVIEFLGRTDDQVKIRGYRIEPGEIEAVLASHAAVRECVVVAREDAPGERRLVAYVAGDAEHAPQAGELRSYLAGKLPDYMVPAAIVFLESLPLTPNGKVDRRALPAPQGPAADIAGPAPVGLVEEMLAAIWAEVLGLESVGAQADFFALGGHSLLATRVMSRLRGAFGVELPLRDLFAAPTLSGLARRVEAALRAGEGLSVPPLVPVPRQAALPLSFAQQRLWFIDQLEPDSPLYNIPIALRIAGVLEIAVLARSLSGLARRHEVLRTIFPAEAGRPRQVILAPREVPLPLVDLSALPVTAREETEVRLVADEARRPFRLGEGPLLRGSVLRLGPDVHTVLVTLHHVVSDGWSMDILVREVAAFYEAYVAGREPALPPLPVQYADFAVWQRSWLQGEALEREIAYWRGQLTGLPPLLELPVDRPRPAVRSQRGAVRPVHLPGELAARVRELSRREGATPFMVLLASFQTLLSRISGQADPAVGTPIAGRNRLETEGLIGFFVNTLALRGDLSGEPSFRGLLGRARETSLAAHTHQDVPFEKLVDELAPERSLSHTPLFQVVLVLQNAPAAAPGFAGLSLAPLPVETGTAKFDLTLNLAERETGIEGQMEYATELFDAATVDRLLEQWSRLLQAALAEPETRVGELPLLTAGERAELLAAWSPQAACLEERTLLELFCDQVERRGEAEAVSFEGERLSYRELGQRACSLARRLRRLGVGPEVRVGLCAERSVDLVVGLLGILEAGGAYVPLDPSYPQERLAYLVEDSGIGIVTGQEAARDRLPAGAWSWVSLEEEFDLEDLPLPAPSPDSAAYVIYTSGSTGRPKGVVVTHRNVARLLRATEAGFGFGPEDVWTLFHSFAFDFSVWELWGALAYGGRLVVVPYWVSRTPEAFLELLERERVTVLNQTPSAFRQLSRIEGEHPLTLRVVIFGGEALEPSSLAGFHRRYPAVRLVNMYGITETTVHVTFRELANRDLESAGSVIGRAIGDLGLYVLDRYGEPVPVGTGGELYVGGAGLARGYLGRPDLTAERFVPDPFGGSGERLYRTGDLGRYVRGGELEYLGRADEQVKIRGFRIELGEIEAALAGHPDVREAVVIARPPSSGEGERRLVGYVVGATGRVLDLSVLRAHLQARLPEHMVPLLMELPALPLTVNGKVDRKALPEPEARRPQGAQRAPQTWAEEVLAGIWARVLELDEVGTEESFFALGGDSILSLQVVALARERGLALELQDLFQHQTIRALAQAVESGTEEAVELAATGPFSLINAADRSLLPEDVEDAYPLTQLQAGMLYHMELAEEDAPYHNVDSWTLRARFDAPLFERAVERVVARHAVLRTSFAQTGYGEPLQLVHRTARLPIAVEDLRGLPEAEQEARIQSLLAREKAHRFDLGQAPQLRFAIQVRTDGSFQFTLTENHAIFDGWSLHTALAEIFGGYFALLEGRELPQEPTPAAAFRDFVALERRALASDEHLRFWDGQMRGWTFTELPPPDPGSPESSRSSRQDVLIPAVVWEGLQRLARELAVPIKSVLLAAHVKAISLLAGSTDVLTGLTSNGRPETPDGDKVCGLFLNLVPFRLLAEPGTWHDLVHRVFAQERAILPFRRFPMPALQRRLGGQRLFEIGFNYIHFHVVEAVLRSGDVEVSGFRGSEGTNLALQAHFTQIPTTSSLGLSLEHDLHRVSPRQAVAMSGLYLRILASIAAGGAGRHDMPLLSESERHQTLVEWNDTAVDASPLPLVHELIARHARRDPGALAVAHGDQTLGYGELNERAGRLARRLAGLGVGPEVRVGLLLERSIELVVGLLAVLEAGGAFVPLDPGYPRDRLAFSLTDSGASLLLTRRDLLESLPEIEGVRPVCLDEPAEREAPVSGVGPDNLAYVLYTSGSTGRPKGVMVPHRGLSHYLAWCLRAYPVTAGWGAPVHSSIAFDLTVTSLFAPLAAGRSIRLLDESPAAEALADALARVAEGEPYSLVKLTPAHLSLLAERLQEGAVGALSFVIGGEALHGEALAFWQCHAPGTRLINEYGPTETVVGCSVYEVPSGARLSGPVPIGRPIAGTRIHLLDGSLQPVVPGSRGELFVGGAGVTRGYLGRPDITADRFRPDPFGASPGERLYKTGDLGRHLPGGDLEFLGRTDYQVKVRGFRVELGEVEAVLASHPAVRECAVLAPPDASGSRRLVAYVVGPEPLDTDELRSFLATRLPEPMVPTAYVTLDALPLTPNGKVDREALPALDLGAMAESYAAPADPTEELLAAIWAEVLGLDAGRVGVHDDFFALGGHSLLATQVASRIRKVFGVELPLRRVFEARTVRDLARVVEEARREGGPQAPPLVPVPRGGALPLSFAQQRLWFLDQLEPESPLYNVPVALRVEGELDVDLLGMSLNALALRHEALRTVFPAVEGSPVQVIRDAPSIPLSLIDLSDVPADERAERVRRLAIEEACRPFHLADGPLLRVSVLRLGAADHAVLLTLHHIVSDAWSMGVLVRELTALYESHAAGEVAMPRGLPALPVQYADFAAWQRGWLQGEALEREIGYWRGHLAGLPPLLELPLDRPRAAVRSLRGAALPVPLPADLAPRVRTFGRQEGATPFMVLLAAFQALLSRYSGQPDLAVGTPVAGRNRLETEGLIGFFVNTLVLRADLTGAPSFRELAGRVRETALAAHTHQDVPFEKLVEELAPDRSLSHTPLFQVVFSLQNAPAETPRLAGARLSWLAAPTSTAKFDLTLTLAERETGLEGSIEYGADLFEAATIDRLAVHFARLLEAALERPAAGIAELPLLTAPERAELVAAWGPTAAWREEATLPELFREQVARRGDAEALSFEDQRLSYRELGRRVGSLARHLRGLGVGPEVRVGLCAERSAHLVVGLLAILEAGGVYVPLDPAYPAERLGFLMADSGVRVVVGQEAVRDRLPAGAWEWVSLEQEPAAAGDTASPPLRLSPDAAAYVIYTSGSTGRPKGVVVSHRNVVRLLRSSEAGFGFGPGDVWTLFHSFAFDFSVWELWGALAYGGRLVVVPYWVARAPQAFAALLEQERVTVLNQTPSAFRQLLRVEGEPSLRLRVVVFGGEALDPTSLRGFHQRYPAVRLVNMYGITETTVHVTYRELAAPDLESAGSVIGRPLGDLGLYLLDRSGEPVPPGVGGELYVGGAGLARGYLGRPDLTSERFVPHPWGGEPGARLYRTGDLGRSLATGELEYLGRADEQVKIRGFRIELGEIEAALASHPGVAESAVGVWPAADGDQRLVGYVVARPGEALDPAALRRHLETRLPEHMVPVLVELEALPLTVNGKVDRRALPAPESRRRGAALLPRTPTEEILLGIWKEVLGIEEAGVEDGFFELGGHSLLATQALTRIRRAFEVEVTLRELFTHPTVAGLAALVEERMPPAPLEAMDASELAGLLDQLDQLSDDEVLSRLGEIQGDR